MLVLKSFEQKKPHRPIKFYDIGAFVWFAHIIEWEFPDFSVDRCFERLIKMQEMIDKMAVLRERFIGI